jgi:formamidopyrimidine-DNA glycosylase
VLAQSARYGKHLFINLEGDGWLHLHFGMSGFVKTAAPSAPDTEHPRVVIIFEDNTRLIYDNRRMIGKVGITPSPETFIQEKGLGPDALRVDSDDFSARLTTAKGKIKQVLMDQRVLAGIGNEYSDEILFQMGIHPETAVQSLGPDTVQRLYKIMKEVLTGAVESGADLQRMPPYFFLTRRKRGGTCPKGHGTLTQLTIAGRTAYICPVCQPRLD